MVPALEGLVDAGVPISADTFSAEVARAALDAGATAINDISGGGEEIFELVAESGCGYVLMHIEGPPRVDREPRRYGDVVDHLKSWFAGRVEAALALGVAEEQIAIDPGLDFDLTTEQDLEILRRLGELRGLGLPLYVSLSRKDFIGAVLAGSWEGRLPPASASGGPSPPSPSRSAPAPTSSASTTAARCRRSGSRAPSGRLPDGEEPARVTLGDRDRPGAARRTHRRRERRRGARGAARPPAGRHSTPPSPRRWPGPGSRASTRTSSKPSRPPPSPTW